jgi:hypothetical protein
VVSRQDRGDSLPGHNKRRCGSRKPTFATVRAQAAGQWPLGGAGAAGLSALAASRAQDGDLAVAFSRAAGCEQARVTHRSGTRSAEHAVPVGATAWPARRQPARVGDCTCDESCRQPGRPDLTVRTVYGSANGARSCGSACVKRLPNFIALGRPLFARVEHKGSWLVFRGSPHPQRDACEQGACSW